MIAVITTVRNGLPFLEENLVSVAAQGASECIHVVVDDGSTDGTAAWLTANWQTRVELILSAPVGRGRALNIGWRAVDAEFVAILDADDAASPVWLQEMLKVMRAHPQIDVLGCRGVMAREHVEDTPSDDAVPEILPADRFLMMNPVHHSGVLIRRQALAKVNGYDESRKSLFDYALWVALLESGACIANLDRGYIFRRIHDRQHFESRKRIAYLKGCFGLRRRVSASLLGGRGRLIPYLTFVYGLLPQDLRHWVRYWRRYGNTARGE